MAIHNNERFLKKLQWVFQQSASNAKPAIRIIICKAGSFANTKVAIPQRYFRPTQPSPPHRADYVSFVAKNLVRQTLINSLPIRAIYRKSV
ncbi:MAG: hypothetical protein WC762_04105 [Methylobacter sp.]